MYLTDYRERTLKDVITQLEPGLFKKVTGLNVKDFELLCSLGVFNAGVMNDAIFKFKRYEDSSLEYTGINKHEGKEIGGWDAVLKREEYEQLFYNQQATMEPPKFDQPEMIQLPPDPPMEVKKVIKKTAKPKTEHKKVEPKQQPTYTPRVKVAIGTKPGRTETKKSDFDMSTVKLGAKVMHKVFGEGTVVMLDINELQIRVQFEKGEKTFLLPGAFDGGFLKLV